MDQLSSLYVRMASGVHSQLHNPSSVMSFVDQMQSRMEKSSAPRKNYLIDPSTPHSDTVIAESSALKPSVGWVTLQVTEGIRRGIHEWGIKIEHHGESNDGSGLMLGIVPKSFTKYDTFISQGGGWCLSRAGKFYGHWRRTDTGGGVLTFGTGDRIVLTLDYEAAVMTVRVGEKTVVGELSGLTMEVFPAISLHYRHQHVRFDHHTVRETASQHLSWLQRRAFPFAPAFLPLSCAEVQRLPLNSYLFSNLFQHHTSLEWSSAMAVEAAATLETPGSGDPSHLSTSVVGATDKKENTSATPSLSSVALAAARQAEQRAMRLYTSSEASTARLTVLSRAFAALRRYVAVVPGKNRFLAPHVTAEYLRQRLHSAAREPTLSSGGGAALTMSGGLSSSSSSSSTFRFADGVGYDATLNCGAVIVVHLFIRAVSSGHDVAIPLIHSFRDYLLSLPLFSLVEYDGCATGNGCGGSSGHARGVPFTVSGSSGAGGARSALAPDTVQLAVDHIMRLVESDLRAVERAAERPEQNSNVYSSSAIAGIRGDCGGDDPAVAPLTSALLEVALVLALQRGLVSEVLRVSRYLLRVPCGVFSPPLVQWLNRHAGALTPQQALPDVGRALKRACEDPSAFMATPLDPMTTVLSVAYGIGATLFVHTADGLTKYGPSAATPYVLVAETRQPIAYCVGAASSSMGVTHTRVLLLSDRMTSAEVALVVYGLHLDTHHVLRWADMHGSWPCTLNSHPQLVSTTEDRLLVVYEDHQQQTPSTHALNGAAAASGTPASAAARSTAGHRHSAAATAGASAEWTVMMHCYNAATASSLAAAPLWTRALHPAGAPAGLQLNRCLALRKPSLVDLGSPEEHLTVAGGQVTIELWVQFLDKEDAATLYQHGDRSTNGEVFLELTKSEGTYCIRGGYRHEMRGSCLVSAPLPPTAESRPFHIALIFNGRWRLLFDGEEVAGNRQGPHVSLDSPKQRWTVGANCTCLLTGLRVWRLGRTTREISRDYRRSLVGDEPGLVVQLFFNEKSGNVVFNYVHNVKACHAVCSGAVAHVACDTHPWRSYGAGVLGGRNAAAASASAAAAGTAQCTSAPSVASSPDVTPACARLHEWRDLAISTCCATRHTLMLRTPISDDGPYARREGGHVLMFFDLSTGVAHPSLFFLTSRSPVRHMMRADPQGRLWELFEVDVGLVKGEQEASYLLSLLGNPGSAPQRPRDRVLAVAPLPLVEDEDGLDSLGTLTNEGEEEDGDSAVDAKSRDSLDWAGTGDHSPPSTLPDSTGGEGSRQVATLQLTQNLPSLSSFMALLSQPSAVVNYSAVALWLLRLLALHAEAELGTDQTLFSPLADDVGSRCVTEVRLILGEHFRVVKSNSARRAMALKSSVSWVVVAATLRILLRLVRRARVFGLHPTPLGLTVVREGTENDDDAAAGSVHKSSSRVSKAAMTLLLRELHASSLRRRASASVLRTRRPSSEHAGGDDTENSAAGSFTLLGLLGDIINEEGLTLSPDVVTLARTTTIEGVELFLPDVRHRAHLLRDLLRSSSVIPSFHIRPAGGGAATASLPSSPAEERVPAMEVLLDAVAQSFATVHAAAPLLGVDGNDAEPGTAASLTELCDTLRTLLEESSVQWRRLWAASATARPLRKFSAFVTSLSEAIASLQLLLLSACQGSRWEVALTLVYPCGCDIVPSRLANAGGAGTGGGQGSSSNGAASSGVAASAGSAGSGVTDSVTAVALDLQRLCFSQAAAYHPCVRAYYGALFDNTECCLNLCMDQSQQQPSATPGQGGDSTNTDAVLSAILSSLTPTFVNAPLHTALSAIPLILAAEDAKWFLNRLEHLLELCETLLERVELPTRPSSSTDGVASTTNMSSPHPASNGCLTSARRLVCSLREAFFYASVWVAAFLCNSTAVSTAAVKDDTVRRRLGFTSVTTTPTTQRQTEKLTGHATSVAPASGSVTEVPILSSAADETASPAVEEELTCVWEHPLLEGGLWPSTPTTSEGAILTGKGALVGAAPPRRVDFVSQLIKNTAYWAAKQSMLDPLASKSHPAMSPLITAMAAAALHLSSTPLERLSPTRVEELMCSCMQKIMRPIRMELLSRRKDGEDDVSGSRQESFKQILTELQHRCEVLLRARTCTELWAMDDALFCIPAVTTSTVASPSTTSSSTSPGSALHRAWNSYKLRRIRFRAHTASHPSLTLREATQLVMKVILSRQLTADVLRAALQQREELAALRRTGVEHILRLVQRAPHSAECAAQLLSAQGRGAHTHYEEGIGGGGLANVASIRGTLFNLLRWSMEEMPAQLSAGIFATRTGGHTALSMTSSAAVLCNLLDRCWRPRDLAVFVHLRVVPTMMETFVTLFVAAKQAHNEETIDTLSAMRGNSDTSGQRRHSATVAAMTTSDNITTSGGSQSAPSSPRAVSVELRHVNLTERQHRDKVVASQQTRYTNKGAVTTSFVPNQTGTNSGGSTDPTLQHTAVEAMQVKVWQCFENLALQSTAMLAPERIVTLSRVEQNSVMAFLADMLGAMQKELRRCRDVLWCAVKDTPVLLAQVSDAAVLEPLVTVQDQVDLVLSFLAVVGGTLSSASVSVSESAPPAHTAVSGTPGAGGSGNDDSDSNGTARFLNRTLSNVCAALAETLLELVCLDLFHARAVIADPGTGCVVRDAAACARVAALLLCRCQPSAVRGIAVAESVWRDMYDSPVFATTHSTSSPVKDSYSSMQTWLNLSMYALATTGMSRTTQHILLGFRRLLHQPAWAAELRGFVSSYQCAVHAYVASVLRSRSSGGKVAAPAPKPEITGTHAGAGSKSSSDPSIGTSPPGRELHVVQLYVWSAVLGGQLLVPPTSPGASVTFLNERSGYQATTACVVDGETVSAAAAAPGRASSTAGTSSSMHLGRPIRGSSHFVSEMAAADCEKVRGVVVVPTDVMGWNGCREEIHLSSNQLFLPGWEAAVVVPSYASLVEDFIAPPLRFCMPLLSEKLDMGSSFTGFELIYFINLLHLTAGVARARPDLGRQLIECGAIKPVRQHALQGMVRLPFPLKALREFGALVAVRAAETASDRIYATDDASDTSTPAGVVNSVTGGSTTIRAAAREVAAALAAVSSTEVIPASTGFRSPFGSPASGNHHPLPGMNEVLLESCRSVTPGPAVGYPATLLSAYHQTGGSSASSGGFLRDTNEYGLSRLARSLGIFGGAAQHPSRAASVSVTSILGGGFGLPSTSARVTPRTEITNGSRPMFLAFPLWPPHSGAAEQPYTPAAVEVTPARAGVHFPVWEDGFAIELAVMLSDGDMYPALGDVLSVPCSWPKQQPLDNASVGTTAVCFPLLTLYTSPGSNSGADLFPFLQLIVQENSIHVSVNLPPSSSGGAPVSKPTLQCCARRALRREDWYHCMHVSVICNAQSLALSRNGEMTSVEWGGTTGIGQHVEALLRQEGAIVKAVLGRAAAAVVSSVPSPREVDGPMALVGGLRLWSTCVLRTSLRVVAELVARDHALQSIGLQENVCYLDLNEGTGTVVRSVDSEKQFYGVLTGAVRWATEPLPLGFYPSIELNTGNMHDGVAAPLPSSTYVPRAAMAAFVDSLSPFYYERFGGDVLWTLLTLAARFTTVTALEVGTSLAYALHCPPDTSAATTTAPASARSTADFDPRQILDPAQKVPYQLLRLFQFHDNGCLPCAHERLIHTVVQRLVTLLAVGSVSEEVKARKSSNVAGATNKLCPTSPLCELVADTAHALRQLRSDDGEIFVIEVPPPSSSSGTTTASAPLTQPVILPLAFTNGGNGALSFDAKYRNMEQATVYKDVELKNVIAKYPDGQGGWPVCNLTATETPWGYLRTVPTSTAHRLGADGKAFSPSNTPYPSMVTVTTKTLKPVIMHAMVKALCAALQRLAPPAAARTRDHDKHHSKGSEHTDSSIAERAAACLLDARVVTSLILQSSARSSEDDCVHFVDILTVMLRLWRDMPHVQPHDQVPLSMAMSHLNIPLCSIIQHANSDSDLGSLVSSATGTYSPYVQSLLGLLVSAVHVDCAWAGRSYMEQLRGRWRRLWGLWQRATVYRPLELTDPGKKKQKTSSSGVSASTGPLSASPPGERREDATREAAIATTQSNTTFRALFLAPSSSNQTRQKPQSTETPQKDSHHTSTAIAKLSTGTRGVRRSSRVVPRSNSNGDDEDPLDVSCSSNAVASSSEGLPAPSRVVELVAMQPVSAETMDVRPSSTSSFAERHDRQPQPPQRTQKSLRRPYPSGVSRKGNGLWVVRSAGVDRGNIEELNPLASRDGAGRGVTTVRSSVGITTGVFYWEVYVANISRSEHTSATLGGCSKMTSNILVGVATERCVPTHGSSGSVSGSNSHADGRDGFLGSDGESWGFDGGHALRWCRGYAVESSPRTRWKMDDVIGFLVDLRQNKFCCLHNGRLVSEFNDTFLSDEQRAARVAVFPVVTCTGEACCEVNFGATGFATTPPPPGCLPVDLSIYLSEETSRVWKVVLADEVSAPFVCATATFTAPAVRPAHLPLSHPVIPRVIQHLTRFTQGRQGPLDVVLLCPDTNVKLVTARECKTDDTASLLFGTVTVTSGRWYFEVVVPTEPNFSVGWYAAKQLEERGSGGRGGAGQAGRIGAGDPTGGTANNGGAAIATPISSAPAQLGSDGASWALDAGRMIARHNEHQVSLSRRAWKCGDVVGCLLDCEAGTVSFSINGEFLKAAHGSSVAVGAGRGGSLIAGRGNMRTTAEYFESTTVASSVTPWAATAASPPSTQVTATTALFSDVSIRESQGLVPTILLEPKSSVVCLWNEEELLFPPTEGGGFRSLGGVSAVHNALVEMIADTDTEAPLHSLSHQPTKKGKVSRQPRQEERLSTPVDAAALQKLLFYASKVQELHPNSLRSYTMPSLYGAHSAAPNSGDQAPFLSHGRNVDGNNSITPSSAISPSQQQQQRRDLCAASGLDAVSLQPHLMALLFFGHLVTLLYPFAHPTALPVTVENVPLGSCWSFTRLQKTLHACQRYAPPWASLRALQGTLDSSNGSGDAVRLSVNRRKALTVVQDTTASATRRLRDSLFGQVYQLLASKAPSFFITNKKLWTVSFYGEGADDVGGPYRECLTQMCAELMSGSISLFLPSANMTGELGEVRDSYVINPICTPPLELHMYRFLGRLMGGCLRGGEPLSLYLPSALWKYLVGEAADDTDMARVDLATLNALNYVEQLVGVATSSGALGSGGDRDDAILNEQLAELCPGGFTLLSDAGVVEELVPGGGHIPVTAANAHIYGHVAREHKLYGMGAAQRRALQQGFHEVVPLFSVSGLKWYELEELVCGQCDYDPDALLDAARYEGLSPNDVRIGFLRRVLRGFTRHQRALFMRFVTGRERLPPGMHLKIMPDDGPRGAPMPPITPHRAAPSLPASAGTAMATMTPQPPPGNEHRGGASFVRHSTLTQSRTSSNVGSITLPPSPPQLDFTPPPTLPVTRMAPPPALQPGQLLPSLDRGDRAPSPLLAATRSPPSIPRQTSRGDDAAPEDGAVDPSLCDDTRLPHASTCFYWLRLPFYTSASVMAQKLLFAIEQCVDIDADFRVHDTDVSEQEVGPSLVRVSSDDDDLFEDLSHLR